MAICLFFPHLITVSVMFFQLFPPLCPWWHPSHAAVVLSVLNAAVSEVFFLYQKLNIHSYGLLDCHAYNQNDAWPSSKMISWPVSGWLLLIGPRTNGAQEGWWAVRDCHVTPSPVFRKVNRHLQCNCHQPWASMWETSTDGRPNVVHVMVGELPAIFHHVVLHETLVLAIVTVIMSHTESWENPRSSVQVHSPPWEMCVFVFLFPCFSSWGSQVSVGGSGSYSRTF